MFAWLVHLITQPFHFSNSKITKNFYLNQIHKYVLYLTCDIAFFFLSEMVTKFVSLLIMQEWSKDYSYIINKSMLL